MVNSLSSISCRTGSRSQNQELHSAMIWTGFPQAWSNLLNSALSKLVLDHDLELRLRIKILKPHHVLP